MKAILTTKIMSFGIGMRKRILRFKDNDGTTYFTNLSREQLKSTIGILIDTKKIIEIKAI